MGRDVGELGFSAVRSENGNGMRQVVGKGSCSPFVQGLVNVPIKHHPTIGDIISNKYLKVMFKIPKTGHLPTPVVGRMRFDSGCGTWYLLRNHLSQMLHGLRTAGRLDNYPVVGPSLDKAPTWRIVPLTNWRIALASKSPEDPREGSPLTTNSPNSL